MLNFHTLVVFLTSGYILLSTYFGIYMYVIAFFSVILMFGQLLIYKKRISVFFCIFLLFSIIVVLISFLINHNINGFNSLIKLLVILSFAFLYCSVYSVKDSVKSFLDIFYVLALISLIIYFSVNILNVNIPSLEITNSNDIKYHYLGFYSYFDGFMKFRNNSIFWEPGIFASFIIFSLYLELYFYNNKRLCRVFIFCICLITTLSSAGIILFLFYLLSIVIKTKVNIKFILLSVVGLLLMFGVINVMLDIINSYGIDPMRSINKLLNPIETEAHRLESPFNLFNIFSLHPFFGLGFDGAMYEYSKSSKISLTSTSLFYTASYGILSIVFFLPFLMFLFINKIKFLEGVILFLVYFFIINKELHFYFISHYLIMFYIFSSFIYKKSIQNE
jgi:hypothetical protein